MTHLGTGSVVSFKNQMGHTSMKGTRGLQRKRLGRYLDLPKTGRGPDSFSSGTYTSEEDARQYHNDLTRKFSGKLLE